MSRRHRSIEEEFRAISPPGFRGIPTAQPIAVGVTGSGGADSSASMSQASQEISRLEAQFRQQSTLIQANTQALQNNTTAHGGGSAISGAGSTASGILGHGLGLLSPIVSGIMSLFGVGSSSSSTALPYYTAPPSVQFSDTLRAVTPAPAVASGGAAGAGATAGGVNTTSSSPQVTVNVSAMDSQSFMDRSSDIANAVRQAMLNLHPINDVVAGL